MIWFTPSLIRIVFGIAGIQNQVIQDI